MASNPPFQVEDNTDEDFFDKLVEDDFGPGGSSVAGFDSYDAKAFATLSFEDSAGEGGTEVKAVVSDSVGVVAESLVAHEVEGNSSLVAANVCTVASHEVVDGNSSTVVLSSVGVVSVAQQSTSDGIGSEVAMDSTVSEVIGSEVTTNSAMGKSVGGSGDSGVKEVGWGSFYADSVQNGGTAMEPYSEFFGDSGDGSSYFPGKVEENANDEAKVVPAVTEEQTSDGLNNSVNYVNYQDGQAYGTSVEQSADGQDMNSSEYWENLYPGWKYDSSTGQWYQVDGYYAAETNAQDSFGTTTADDWNAVSDGATDVSYFQTAQSIAETVTEPTTSETVSNWGQVSQVNGGYPEHMYFDPQYPGWYFDTIAQEWRSLEAYNSSLQSTVQTHGQQSQNGFASYDNYTHNNDYKEYGQADNYATQGLACQGEASSWSQSQSYTNYSQQGVGMWQPDPVSSYKEPASNIGGTQQFGNSYGSMVSANALGNQKASASFFGEAPLQGNNSHYHSEANGTAELQSFAPVGNFSPHLNQASAEQNLQMHLTNDYYDSSKAVNDYHGNQASQESVNFLQQPFQNGNQFSPDTGRSSDGRPPHALVTFGFGGKLIVMKDNSLRNSSYGSQDPAGGSISVLNLLEVVMANASGLSPGNSSCDYFLALCQQSFPGPLAGGSVGNKELNKWLDERIASCDSANMDYRISESLRLLLHLLKISCQHYGKLRSPFGKDSTTREDDLPESAVAKLFASAKRNGAQFSEYGTISQCLQNLPSEGQIRATASQVQNLLVSGRKIEALHCAKEGQLWGPALVLASQLGDQFYVDTVKHMALQQLVAGSPMRTLCLLIAGQPADVFSTDATSGVSLPAAMNMSQQPAQSGANGMLDDWEENLAVITANRTKDDELVIIHLGDCLWRERSEILAAHICYLIAEANFESYSDSARLCLIGADHWKLPRTYASPEAIQRTELHEYSKVLGNSQFILLPFQPYKLIYAHMLAEVGKVSDSLKYCQALLKSLKTGRAPEVETWKQLVLSLEERIRTHQQGGYSVNLAPAKLVGKLLNFFDSTAHRVVGGLPPPAPSPVTQGGVQSSEQYHHQPTAPRVATSQSTMAMSSLVPSASMEPISDKGADGNRMMMHNRSASEPSIGTTPRQADSSTHVTPKDATPKDAQEKSSSGASRFPRFGFGAGAQFIQKTMGLVLRSRSDKQAKLGEKNKFYYDEKLKRWVEDGVDPPAEEAALPPPPTTASFPSGSLDYNLKSAIRSDGSPPTGGSPKFKNAAHASGIPPIPPSSNQFSARGRMGVRSRYVDTFNQGSVGNAANTFQSPSVPSTKQPVSATPNFFIPAAVSSPESAMETTEQPREALTSPVSSERTMASMDENLPEDSSENPSTSNRSYYSFQSPPSSSASLQRYPSMDNIPNNRTMANRNDDAHPSQSRRTASWSGGSGSFSDTYSSPQRFAMPPSSFFMPRNPSSMMNSGSSGDELHEVEL